MMRWPLVLALAGCSSGSDAPTCASGHLDDCPDCGVGEIRYGTWFTGLDGLGSSDRGIEAVTQCGTAYTLDPTARVVDERQVSLDRYVVDFATVPSGGSYVMTNAEYDWTLTALDADWNVRWTHTFTSFDDGEYHFVAGPEGPYVFFEAFAYQNRTVSAYDVDGNLRWSAGPEEVVPDGLGGTYRLSYQFASGSLQESEVDLAHYDTTNGARWTRKLVASSPDPANPPRVGVSAIRLSSSGDTMMAGKFNGSTLDLGDLQVVATGQTNMFVAVVDAAGSTRWAHVVNGSTMLRSDTENDLQFQPISIVADGEQLVLAGSYGGQGGELDLPPVEPGGLVLRQNGFIAHYDANGLVRAEVLAGDEDVFPSFISDIVDGTAWVRVETVAPHTGAVQLDVGSRVFVATKETSAPPAPGANLGWATFIVQMVP